MRAASTGQPAVTAEAVSALFKQTLLCFLVGVYMAVVKALQFSDFLLLRSRTPYKDWSDDFEVLKLIK